MQITVVIPTHDRPELLREAMASVEAQGFDQWDVIVVDDGSRPPARIDPLVTVPLWARIRLLRNEEAQGLSEARNAGMRAATGDVIFFLDDDDLLEADVLARIDAAFQRDTDLNCLFVNVETFGRYAEGTRHNQARALERTLTAIGKRLDEGGVLRLNSEQLFGALLERLPMAFQRVAIRRTQLDGVGFYSGKAFGDLEWNYRVALRGTCGLLVTPGYRVRCEGQSYFSRAEQRQRLIDTNISIREGLLNLEEVAATTSLRGLTMISLANAHFEKAHHAYRHDLPFPWRSLFRSTASGLQWRHFSLAAKALGKHIRQVASGGGNSSNCGRAS